MKKRVRICLIISVLFIANYILVRVQGVSAEYWRKLGFPNAARIFMYKADCYPGHSLECIRFPKKLMRGKKDGESLTYSEAGTGFSCNGYQVKVGDSREEVKEQFKYSNPDGDGTEYELGCYFCDTGYLLEFMFTYDGNDQVTAIKVTKECYRE